MPSITYVVFKYFLFSMWYYLYVRYWLWVKKKFFSRLTDDMWTKGGNWKCTCFVSRSACVCTRLCVCVSLLLFEEKISLKDCVACVRACRYAWVRLFVCRQEYERQNSVPDRVHSDQYYFISLDPRPIIVSLFSLSNLTDSRTAWNDIPIAAVMVRQDIMSDKAVTRPVNLSN